MHIPKPLKRQTKNVQCLPHVADVSWSLVTKPQSTICRLNMRKLAEKHQKWSCLFTSLPRQSSVTHHLVSSSSAHFYLHHLWLHWEPWTLRPRWWFQTSSNKSLLTTTCCLLCLQITCLHINASHRSTAQQLKQDTLMLHCMWPDNRQISLYRFLLDYFAVVFLFINCRKTFFTFTFFFFFLAKHKIPSFTFIQKHRAMVGALHKGIKKGDKIRCSFRMRTDI